MSDVEVAGEPAAETESSAPRQTDRQDWTSVRFACAMGLAALLISSLLLAWSWWNSAGNRQPAVWSTAVGNRPSEPARDEPGPGRLAIRGPQAPDEAHDWSSEIAGHPELVADRAWPSDRTSDAVVRDPSDVIPVAKRWQLEFEAGLTEGPYARQLDALNIELAVIGDDGQIHYASQLAEAPTQRSGPMDKEDRLYLTWDRGDLVNADRILLAKAGIDSVGKIVLHFCPAETIAEMTRLEQQFADRQPSEVFVTRFAIRRTFRGYELYVKEQIPR